MTDVGVGYMNGGAPHTLRFVIRERYVWVECAEPGYEGLQIEVRVNMTNGERQALIEELDEIAADRDTMTRRMQADAAAIDAERAASVESGDVDKLPAIQSRTEALLTRFEAALTANNDRRLALIAPFVRGWNVYRGNEEDGYEPVPPPAVGGVESFAESDPFITGWIAGQLLTAYRGGKGMSSAAKTSAAVLPPGNERGARMKPAAQPNGHP